MKTTKKHPLGKLFQEYIFEKFEEWEDTQPNRRSSISAFARWLSDNTYDVEIKQQIVNSWIKGSLPKEEKYLLVLREKFGKEVYEILDAEPPNDYLLTVQKFWEFIPESVQKRLAEEAAKYETKTTTEGVAKVHKRTKTGTA